MKSDDGRGAEKGERVLTPGDRVMLSSKHWLAGRHGTDAEILEIDPTAGERHIRVELPSKIKVWVSPKELMAKP